MEAGLEVARGRSDAGPLLVLCDAGGCIRALNAAFARFSGYDPVALIGRSFSDLLPASHGWSLEQGRVPLRFESAAGDVVDLDLETNSLLGDGAGDVAYALVLQPRAITLGAGDPHNLAAGDARGPSLSERERQILDLVAEGYRVATIARGLFISPSTVRNHLSAIFRKLGVANQAELLELLKRSSVASQ